MAKFAKCLTLIFGIFIYSTNAFATLIEFKFTGVMTGGGGNIPGFPFPNGTPVSGRYFFESTTQDGNPSAEIGSYGDTIKSFEILIDSVMYRLAPGGSGFIRVSNDINTGTANNPVYHDFYDAETTGSIEGPEIGTTKKFKARGIQVKMTLLPTTFDSTALPLSPPPLQNQPQLWYIRYQAADFSEFSQIEGRLDTFVMPMPNATLLVLIGFASLAFAHYRQH